MSEPVYLDSGAFIAFLIRADRHHKETAALFQRPPRHAYTSVLVVSETYSWFLHRLGEEAARAFRELLDRTAWLEVLCVDPAHVTKIWAKLDALRGSKLSFVDASSLVLLAERKLAVVWGTDQHLALEGAIVLPGPT